MLITETTRVHLAPAGTRRRKDSIDAPPDWDGLRKSLRLAYSLFPSRRRYIHNTWNAPTLIPDLCFEVGSVRGGAARKLYQARHAHP